MKISRHWCADFLATTPPSERMASLLTGVGLEVDACTDVAAASGVVSGRVVACAPHPDAERLQVCEVEVGDETATIVCGAPNVRAGLAVAVARPGAQLGELTISRRAIRGVESAGMICSAKELGIGEDGDTILELTEADAGAVGDDLARRLSLNDVVLEVGVTPNRGDCLSHLGVARELSAAADVALQPPSVLAVADTEESVPVQIDDDAADACPYYGCLLVREVDCRRPSPAWLRSRIERCGGRSVNAVVDVTNYLMLAFGQPLHAFDCDKLNGGIRVRFAEPGEKLRVLDGSTVACEADTLMIADEKKAVALAGVMGGLDTGVTETTRHVLLEAAFFSPNSVRGRARRFNLNSDAAFRFERGVDSRLPPVALSHAARLIKELCGGQAGVVHAAGAPPPTKRVSVPVTKIHRTLGMDINGDESATLLNRWHLPADVQTADGAQQLSVTAPSWRFDLNEPIDLVEEIARAWGYEKLTETRPLGARAMPRRAARPLSAAAARAFFVGRGFYEIISYSFVPAAWQQQLDEQAPLPLANPMSEEMAVMRTNLWGGLLHCAKFNARHRQERVQLFEIGRCFLSPAAGDELPQQPMCLAGVAFGAATKTHWSGAPRPFDFYDMKGVVESFFERETLDFQPLTTAAALHPGMAATILWRGVAVGQIGVLHPRQPLAAEFKSAVTMFSLNLDLAAATAPPPPPITAVSRYPMVWRDAALWVDEALPIGDVLACARRRAPAPPVADVFLFDFFGGDSDNIPSGKKSCGLRFCLQGEHANLTGEDIQNALTPVLDALQQECSAVLRD